MPSAQPWAALWLPCLGQVLLLLEARRDRTPAWLDQRPNSLLYEELKKSGGRFW